jgi:hypothetical protein
MTKPRVTVFQNGKAIACDTRPMGETVTIIGGERDAMSAWFIVVRRDKPHE